MFGERRKLLTISAIKDVWGLRNVGKWFSWVLKYYIYIGIFSTSAYTVGHINLPLSEGE